MRYLCLLILLAGCTVTPEYCRSWGVNVPDGAEITGTIIEEHISDSRTVQARCHGVSRYGCAIPVNEGQWVIWRIDDNGVAAHEACHCLFETREHVSQISAG